jgi:enoyl-CoA hydratase/carnithine racemase
LVTGVYDSKRLIDEALALAEVISTKAPMAVSATKAIIEASENPQIPDVREFARLEIMKLAKSKDHQLALDAFKKKQTPIFNGN